MNYDLNNGGQEYYITAACIVLFMGSLWAYWHYLNDKHKEKINKCPVCGKNGNTPCPCGY